MKIAANIIEGILGGRAMMARTIVLGCGANAVLFTCSLALAADLPVKAPVRSAVYDWTGFYLGGHTGYGGGSFGPGSNPLPEQGVFHRTAPQA
jgi:high affinity Mn2+ porin